MARNRLQFGVALLIGFFLLATLFAVLLYALAPATPAVRGPILLTAFIAILIGSLLCILFLLRWLVRPYRQLVGEAERAPVAAHRRKSTDEAQFVLETFQSVVAKLQAQQKELERLSVQARARGFRRAVQRTYRRKRPFGSDRVRRQRAIDGHQRARPRTAGC